MRSGYRSLTGTRPNILTQSSPRHINASLHEVPVAVSRRQAALAISLAQKKTAEAVSDACIRVSHPAKAGC